MLRRHSRFTDRLKSQRLKWCLVFSSVLVLTNLDCSLRVTQAESPVKTHTRQANERSVLWKRKMTDLTYPSTRRDNITDDYHGTTLEDPYRWLEDTESEETAVWVQAQNDITFEYLSAIPTRQPIVDRLTKLWNYERFGRPF